MDAAVNPGLTNALRAVYNLVEMQREPNGIAPEECGDYQEIVSALYETYHGTVTSTKLLVEYNKSQKDPHCAAIEDVRDLWQRHVRLALDEHVPLINEMHKAVTQTVAEVIKKYEQTQPDLVDILAKLDKAPDQPARHGVANDLIDAASHLNVKDLNRLVDAMRQKLGFSQRWINDWKRAIKETITDRRDAAKLLVPASEEAATDAQRPTWPYGIDDGRLLFYAQRADMFGRSNVVPLPIADFSAKITRELETEDGRKKFIIEGETIYGRPFEREMNVEDFADGRKLKALMTVCAGAQAPINVGMEKHLGVAIQRVSGQVPVSKYFTRTGWANGAFIIPGDTADDVVVALNRKQPYEFRADADIDLGLQALEALLLSHTPQSCGPILAFLLASPLALFAGWRNERYGMFIAGRTGSLKSSWSQAAMCLYGPDFIRDELLVKWGQGATNTAIMAMAKSVYDLPFLIDNYKPNTGDGAKGFVNLIHNIVEGGERDRCFQGGELKDSQPVFAWPLVTGEDVPDQDPATLARVLVVPFAKPKSDPVHLSEAQRLSAHLCAIGASWVHWLTGDGKEIVQKVAGEFVEARRRWKEELTAYQPDMVNVWRIASNLATNELTWAIAELHPVIGPLFQKHADAYGEGLEQISHTMANYTAETLEGSKFIDLLRQMLLSEQAVLVKRGEKPGVLDGARMVGWKADDGGAYVSMDLARTLIERHFGKDCLNNLSNKTLYSQMIDLGYLIPGKDKATQVLKELGALYRVMRFKRHTFHDDDGISEE